MCLCGGFTLKNELKKRHPRFMRRGAVPHKNSFLTISLF